MYFMLHLRRRMHWRISTLPVIRLLRLVYSYHRCFLSFQVMIAAALLVNDYICSPSEWLQLLSLLNESRFATSWVKYSVASGDAEDTT